MNQTTAETSPRYIVKTSSAKMPASCWGTYRRVAVLEVEPGAKPAMISERARGVVRVVRTWEKCSDRGTNTAFRRALREAEELARKLNAG